MNKLIVCIHQFLLQDIRLRCILGFVAVLANVLEAHVMR